MRDLTYTCHPVGCAWPINGRCIGSGWKVHGRVHVKDVWYINGWCIGSLSV